MEMGLILLRDIYIVLVREKYLRLWGCRTSPQRGGE